MENPMILGATQQKRWYPKLTPFRLSTLLTGIGLGVLKAVLTSQGSQVAPVALEWLCGTVFLLLFYFLDIFERDIRLDDDTYYHWFYDYDCLDFVWEFLKSFGINAPEYSNSEAPEWNLDVEKQIITNYRLLVSATILFLGMLKAVLTYLGKSEGATSVDWIFGVVVTAGLYILGLYERNTAELLPALFRRNDSPLMLFMGYEGGIILLSIGLTCIFVIGATYIKGFLVVALYSEDHDKIDLTTRDGITTLTGKILFVSILVIVGYATLFPLYYAFVVILRYFEPSAVIPRLVASFMQRYNLNRFKLRYVIPTQTISDLAIYIFRSTNHIILHTFFLVVLSCASILTGSFAIDLLHTSLFLVGLFLSPLVLMIAAAPFLVAMSMMRPFYRLWKSGVWRGKYATDMGFFF